MDNGKFRLNWKPIKIKETFLTLDYSKFKNPNAIKELFKPRYFEHSTWIMWLSAYGLSEFDSNVEKNQWLENVCPKSKKDCEEYTLHYIIWNW